MKGRMACDPFLEKIKTAEFQKKKPVGAEVLATRCRVTQGADVERSLFVKKTPHKE